MEVDLKLVSVGLAKTLSNIIVGQPSEDRVLIVHSDERDRKTKGGLYVPDNAREDIPKKGVVVKFGPINDTYRNYIEQLKIGSIITYGMYAGKEIIPTITDSNINIENYKFSVLSLNEIIFVEPNK